MATIKDPVTGEQYEVSEDAALAFHRLQAQAPKPKRGPRVTHDGHHSIDIPPCPRGCKFSRAVGTVIAGPEHAAGTGVVASLALIEWECRCGETWKVLHPIAMESIAVQGKLEKKYKPPVAYLKAGDVLDVRNATQPHHALRGIPHFIIHKNLTPEETAKLDAREARADERETASDEGGK